MHRAGGWHGTNLLAGGGSARRGIALRTPTATFVGPDNGLFSPFLGDAVACVALTNTATHRPRTSHTFHGRDVFAPVAAHLANGLHFGELGPPIDDPVALAEVQPLRMPDGRLVVEVMHVDRFGNLVYRGAMRSFNAIMAPAAQTTIVEVEEIVSVGSLDPETVVTPEVFVDRIVQCPGEGL